MSKGRENKHKDFYIVQQSLPTSTPLSTPGLRISLSKPPKTSNAYNWHQCVNEPLQQEIILNLLTQVYSNTYNLSIWFYKKNYKTFSHTMCLNTNESPICVNKWNGYAKFILFDLQRKCSKY